MALFHSQTRRHMISPNNVSMILLQNQRTVSYEIYDDESKKKGNDQESIQSSTTPDPGQDTNGKVTTSKLDITNESQPMAIVALWI